MLLRVRMDVMAAAFLAAFVLEVAAYPSSYAGFAVDDVRRPIYRGSTRYKRHSFVDVVKTDLIASNNDNDSIIFRTNQILNSANEQMPLYKILVKRDLDNSRRERETDREIKKTHTVTSTVRADSFSNDSSENEEWEFVHLESPLLKTDDHLVKNFFKNSIRILKSHASEKFGSELNPAESIKAKHESLDKLILSHTNGKLPIQMYPEQRPHDWDGKPKDPTVIVIEDVHPSKLPKPDGHWVGNRPFDYQQPHVTSRPPSNYYAPQNSNNHVSQPTRPPYGVGSWGHPSTQSPHKPQSGHSPIILIENVTPPTSHGQWGQYQPGPVYKPDLVTKPPTTSKPLQPVFVVGNGRPTQSQVVPQIQGGQISVQIVTTTTTPTLPIIRPTTVPVYHHNENDVVYKPITLKPKPPSQKPKPTRPSLVTPVTGSNPVLATFQLTTKPPKVKPQHSNPKPITVKPVFLHPKPQKPNKKPSQSKPVIIPSNVPAYYGLLGLNQDSPNSTGIWDTSTKPPTTSSSSSSSSLQATVIVQNNWPSLRPVYNYPTTSPPRPVQSTPIYVTNNKPLVSNPGSSHVSHKPVLLYPRPGPSPEPPPKPLVPIHPPLNESPRPPEAPYRDPPIKPNHPLGNAVIISQTTSLPPITPPVPVRPRPPSIVILEAEPEPPPIINDCGTIQIINKDSKTEKSCSDVMILLNSPLALSNGASAASSSSSGIAAAGGASIAAGAAAAGAAGAGASLAAGAAGSTLAAGTAGIAALAGASAANSVGSAGNGQGSSGGSSSQIIPLAPPVSTPVLHPVEDETSSEEDYDYTDDNTPPSPSSTSRPTTKPSSSTTLLDYFSSFGSALPLMMGPFSISVWVVMMGPLIFLLIGTFAVGSLLIPWFLPRILFGRRRRRRRSLSYSQTVNIPASAYLFLKNLDSGHFSIYD